VIDRIPYEEYAAIDATNISCLLHMARSPRHYLHAIAGAGGRDTPAMAFGRLVHCSILEPERFASEVVVWRDGRRAGKAWDAFKAEAEAGGKTIATEDEHETCMAMSIAVYDHPAAASHLLGAKNVVAEHTLRWRHRLGLELKGRIDWADLDNHVIVDVKTARDATEIEFGKAAARLRYPTRAAWYCAGYEATYGHTPIFVFVVVEKEAPYAVAVYRLPGDALESGRREFDELLGKLAACRESGEYPGIAGDRETDLLLPSWAFGADLGLDLVIDGEAVTL
jgi:hypothetical protein